MSRRNDRRTYLLLSVLALAALLLSAGGAGLVRAQDATPSAGDNPPVVVPVPTNNQTGAVSTADTGESTAPPEVSPPPSPSPSPSPSMAPSPSPSPSPSVAPATPASPRLMTESVSVVPEISVTDFSPVTSAYNYPVGYPVVSTSATVNLSVPDGSDIAAWQISFVGNGSLIATLPAGTTYVHWTQVTYQGFTESVTCATPQNVGQDLSTSIVIAQGNGTCFTSGSPNDTLSFGITFDVRPYVSNLPGTYTGNMTVTISEVPPAP